MAPKTDYATQFKELKDLIETTNNNIKGHVQEYGATFGKKVSFTLVVILLSIF